MKELTEQSGYERIKDAIADLAMGFLLLIPQSLMVISIVSLFVFENIDLAIITFVFSILLASLVNISLW